MSQQMQVRAPISAAIMEKVLIGGDLSKLTSAERLSYYKAVCESVGLNPLTQPFDYITLNGKLRLYAKKDCTDQIRANRSISIDKLDIEKRGDDFYVVIASASDQDGRQDIATAVISIASLKGELLANAMMKAETKAKRRVTLSLAGLGWADTDGEPVTIPPSALEEKELTDEEEEKLFASVRSGPVADRRPAFTHKIVSSDETVITPSVEVPVESAKSATPEPPLKPTDKGVEAVQATFPGAEVVQTKLTIPKELQGAFDFLGLSEEQQRNYLLLVGKGKQWKDHKSLITYLEGLEPEIT